ncbi:MAG: ATP-dependent Clp protease adaptor ClpS [Nitrospinota bacterium]
MSTEALPLSPGVVEESEGRTDRAYLPMYKIIMWDDNVTTMEFVIRILITLLGKEYSTAEKLMYEIHLQGAATVATLPLEQAEFKVEQVHRAAAMEEFPFTCTIEQA